MATLMDMGVMSNFALIFTFLLTFAMVYGILTYTKMFGKENAALNAVIALVCGILVLFSDTVVQTINRSAPWFVVFFFFIMFLLIGFKFFGATDEDIVGVIKNPEHRTIVYWIIGVSLVIVLGTLFSVLTEKGGVGHAGGAAVNATGGEVPQQTSEFWRTITHPKVLGMLLILLIAAMTVQRLVTFSKK